MRVDGFQTSVEEEVAEVLAMSGVGQYFSLLYIQTGKQIYDYNLSFTASFEG